jgi:outer membrane protein assembly factor BamB
VWESKVCITQATGGGKLRSLWCIDRERGGVVWRRDVEYAESEPTHETNPYCSASPVTDGERVVASHGSAGVFCYDFDGKELWHRDLGKFHHIWGNAASPVLHGDLCILNCGPGPRTSLVALDKKNGATRWQVDIPGGRESGDAKTWTGSWSTPLVFEEAGKTRILASFPLRLRAFDVREGEEVWSCDGLGNLVYTSPLMSDGIAVAMSGFMGPPLAVRTGGSGDVSAERRLWREERAPQRIGSGVVHEGHIYIVNDSGAGQCIDLRTGKEVWKERAGATSWSSLVLTADGLLYGADQEGTFFVLRASPRFERVAENRLGETTRASVAVSGGLLFLRTYNHLWCIDKAD